MYQLLMYGIVALIGYVVGLGHGEVMRKREASAEAKRARIRSERGF